jgi:hypothetical protein
MGRDGPTRAVKYGKPDEWKVGTKRRVGEERKILEREGGRSYLYLRGGGGKGSVPS